MPTTTPPNTPRGTPASPSLGEIANAILVTDSWTGFGLRIIEGPRAGHTFTLSKLEANGREIGDHVIALFPPIGDFARILTPKLCFYAVAEALGGLGCGDGASGGADWSCRAAYLGGAAEGVNRGGGGWYLLQPDDGPALRLVRRWGADEPGHDGHGGNDDIKDIASYAYTDGPAVIVAAIRREMIEAGASLLSALAATVAGLALGETAVTQKAMGVVHDHLYAVGRQVGERVLAQRAEVDLVDRADEATVRRLLREVRDLMVTADTASMVAPREGGYPALFDAIFVVLEPVIPLAQRTAEAHLAGGVRGGDFDMTALTGPALTIAVAVHGLLRQDLEDRYRDGVRDRGPTGGGCKAFYTPEQWEARGEDHDEAGAVLVLVHDGGDLGPYCNPAYEDERAFKRLGTVLASLGYRLGDGHGWWVPVYPIVP